MFNKNLIFVNYNKKEKSKSKNIGSISTKNNLDINQIINFLIKEVKVKQLFKLIK